MCINYVVCVSFAFLLDSLHLVADTNGIAVALGTGTGTVTGTPANAVPKSGYINFIAEIYIMARIVRRVSTVGIGSFVNVILRLHDSLALIHSFVFCLIE